MTLTIFATHSIDAERIRRVSYVDERQCSIRYLDTDGSLRTGMVAMSAGWLMKLLEAQRCEEDAAMAATSWA